MSVDLDAIPDPAPPIRRPDTRRWLVALGFTLLTGVSLALWNWKPERTNLVFWLCTQALPVALWGACFTLRRFSYKCDQVWAASWNRERRRLTEQEIQRGQRCARVLYAAVSTQIGSGPEKLMNAVIASSPIMAVSTPRAGGAPVRHTELPGFPSLQPDALDTAITRLITQLAPVLANTPASLPCALIMDCDVPDNSDISARVAGILANKTQRTFKTLRGHGPAALDRWLDEGWFAPSLLLVFSAVLRSRHQEGDGEAITLLALANRPLSAFPQAVRLHRPEQGSSASLKKALARALLWASLPPDALKDAWLSGPLATQGGAWIQSCEDNGLALNLTEDNHNIDMVTGDTGRASPWLALVLAACRAGAESTPQVAVMQDGESSIWIAGVTPDALGSHQQDQQ